MRLKAFKGKYHESSIVFICNYIEECPYGATGEAYHYGVFKLIKFVNKHGEDYSADRNFTHFCTRDLRGLKEIKDSRFLNLYIKTREL